MTKPDGGRGPAVLIINPRSDEVFGRDVASLAEGAWLPAELQSRLRDQGYPLALVRARELAGQVEAIWYVYREGHWIPDERDTRG
ncbi:MAG: hypothetical protein ABI725_02520 [Chloroflexota bacterium]